MRRITLGQDDRIVARFWVPNRWVGMLIGRAYLRIQGWRHG
jgi:hypothetical protein